jgi:hypothetical protein
VNYEAILIELRRVADERIGASEAIAMQFARAFDSFRHFCATMVHHLLPT